MLINVLQAKKEYILNKNNLINTQKEKGKNVLVSFETAKNNSLKFKSSKIAKINLEYVEPKDIKLF